MEQRIDHSVLGLIIAEKWEWRVQQRISFPCAGYATKEISIVEASPDGPNAKQLDALVDLIERPVSFRDTIANAIFSAYVQEIRPEYFEILSDTRYDYGVTLADLPEVTEPKGIWDFVTGLYSIWVTEDALVDVQFSVTFDQEHELHVEFKDGVIDRVWME